MNVNFASNSTILSNLTAYTIYVINVSAVSPGGKGPANTARARTQAEGNKYVEIVGLHLSSRLKWIRPLLLKKSTSVKAFGWGSKKKEKNTDPLCVARKCIRTESQKHGDFFPENDSSWNFYRKEWKLPLVWRVHTSRMYLYATRRTRVVLQVRGFTVEYCRHFNYW